jgi:hypothetical protein
MTEPQSIQIKAKAYFAIDPAARTRRDRKEFLAVLGLEHPGHFLRSVWTPTWEAAIDDILDPRSSFLRPLNPSDFHFKWAVGAINLLPTATRLNILGLKMKPAGLEAALKKLLAAGGYPAADFVIEDVEILRQIHSEYSIKLRTADARQLRVEVSHYLPAAEEIFHRFAGPLNVPVTAVLAASTPHGTRFIMELEEPDRVELTVAPHERLAAFGDRIIERAALHDAAGDILGTVMRDPHYLLAADGELFSFHHYQLFMDLDDEQFGFFQPVFAFLGRELGDEPGWFAAYRTAYIREFKNLQARRDEILHIFDEATDIVSQYLGGPGGIAEVRKGMEQRLAFDPEQRVRTIGELFAKC